MNLLFNSVKNKCVLCANDVTDIRSAQGTNEFMANTFHKQLSKQFERERLRFAHKRVRHIVARAVALDVLVRFANVAHLREVLHARSTSLQNLESRSLARAYFPRHVRRHCKATPKYEQTSRP